MKRATLLLILHSVIFELSAQILNGNIGFESGTWSDEWRNNNYGDTSSITEIITSPNPVRSGEYALRLEAMVDNRNEIIPLEAGDVSEAYFNWNQEYWLGISVYLSNYSINPSNWTTIIQAHSIPSEDTITGRPNWDGCCAGENGWTLGTRDNFFEIHSNVLDSPLLQLPICRARNGYAWIQDLDEYENRWVDVVIHWKHSTQEDGFIQWWVDGELVVDQAGPNIHYLDVCGLPRTQNNYLQLGIYKELTGQQNRVIYVDEIRIAGDSSNYQDVAPGGGGILNRPPVLERIGDYNIRARTDLSILLSAKDFESDPLTFSISDNFEFIELIDNHDGTGLLLINPTKESIGTYELTIFVTDSNQHNDAETITIEIENENSLPIMNAIGDWTVYAGGILNIPLSSFDADGDSLYYSLFNENFGFLSLSDFRDGTGLLKISPSINEIGLYEFIVLVTDDYNGSDSEIVRLTVDSGGQDNVPPTLRSIDNQRLFVGDMLSIQLLATDFEGDNITYEVLPDLHFLYITQQNDGYADLIITPEIGDAGIYNPEITITDIRNNKSSKHFSLIIDDIANPPYSELINSGGLDVNNGSFIYVADQYFYGGKINSISDSIANTEINQVYLTERYGNFNYDIPVPVNGSYTLKLHFAEIEYFNGSVGSRIFDVNIENEQKELINLDINAEAGPARAMIKTFTGIIVKDGKLTIQFKPIHGNAKISGIEVMSEMNLITDIDPLGYERKLRIFPNPSDGFFKIFIPTEKNSPKKLPFTISDVFGRIIYISEMENFYKNVDMTLEDKGIYFLRIDDFETGKIFIK